VASGIGYQSRLYAQPLFTSERQLRVLFDESSSDEDEGGGRVTLESEDLGK
jgi:hypothetical protein